MSEALDFIINHVFLPPCLPHEDDDGVEETNALIETVLAALELFQDHIPEQQRSEWIPCIKMIRNMRELRDKSGHLIAEKVEEALREMLNGEILALHIAAQNAGLIVRRFSDQYSFESFEVAPKNEAVTTTKGRLRRCFPGPAVAISQDRIADPSFLVPLTDLLASLDTETPEEVCPTTKKAGSKVIEIRDTVHPRMVTEMLTGILRAVGRPLEISRIYKHTREDVCYKDALKPWRRSPAWLFLRVALQTSLLRHNDEKPHNRYKSLMIFVLAYVLDSARKVSTSSDMLFIMIAKISRRMLKLEMTNEKTWMKYIEKVTEAVQQVLAHRWNTLERNPDPQATQLNWLPSQLSFLDDTRLRLSKLRPYLDKIAARTAIISTTQDFTSDCRRRVSPSALSLPDLGILRSDHNQTRLNLIDLELWVSSSLDDWLHANMKQQNTSTALSAVIQTYTSVASSTYAGEPEDISLMILTSMELWIALDKCVLYHHPRLHQYDPEFPPSLFEPLLLPKKPQMERLSQVEKYLAARKQAAKSGHPSIFQVVDSRNSFAVQHFEHSPHHQELRRKIEADAEIERSRKKEELAEKRKEYQKSMKELQDAACETYTQYNRKGRPYVVHDRRCQKCELKSKVEKLSIDVHEWPLPQKELQAKAAVFELDVPIEFGIWRDTTYSLLVDILSGERNILSPDQRQDTGGVMIPFHNYADLRKYNSSRVGRVQLASRTKPFISSHYRSVLVSQASKQKVCVNNGLNFDFHDSYSMKWTNMLLGFCDVSKKCTLNLPAGPYERLQFVVDGTSHTSNEVIARQAECPAALTMHEYYAFGTLRSGFRLQWRNIARELLTGVLNFNCREVNILVTQAAWQCGPISGEVYRESHVDLAEEAFGSSLLSVLNSAVHAIESNWQNVTAARILVALTTRLLSLCTSDEIRDGCCLFLRRARVMLLRWSRELGEKLQRGQEKGDELKNLNRRTLEMALTCYGTFDVDLPHLPYLISSDGDIADVTECSVIIQSRCPAVTDDLPSSIKMLLRRHRRLACLFEPSLRKKVTDSRHGLDSTVSRCWVGYKPGSPWTALKAPSERWLMTETAKQNGLSSMTIHFNLLDGTLLVNGSPLTRLPHSYEAHPTFHRLFGEIAFDVVPSTMSEMVFEARNKFFDHQLYFGMQGSELIIRASKQDQIFELLPTHVLDGDFPHAFVQDFAHWVNIQTGVVEWRPLQNAWTSASDNWHMRFDVQKRKFLVRDSSRLIDIHTPTAKAVSLVLSPLEHSAHIHITFNSKTGVLEVHLPRLNLGFFLRKESKRLESKQFRGMVIDANQSFGTFTGLVNKLVLLGDHNSARSVIIPHGDVLFHPRDFHVSIHIESLPKQRSYYIYHIDNRLGRLVDNGTLKSRLFKSYLHAVTAHCLTDELTGRTGTEEALSILASSSVCSFLRLEQTEIDLLFLLARLAPRRQYYPEHLKVMQQTDWGTLSPLSQHDTFLTLVSSIFEKARTMDLFHETPTKVPNLDTYTKQHLLQRANIRNSTYRVQGFGAENHTSEYDLIYNSRDHIPNSKREAQVHHIATLVDGWSKNMKCCSNLLQEIQSWEKIIHGRITGYKLPLGYDMKWLEPVANHFPGEWCALQIALSHSIAGADKYQIMIFLSTLMYSQPANRELVQTLLAFATVSELRAIEPPQFKSYNLSDGFAPDRRRLEEAARNKAQPFFSCPESELAQLSNETYAEAGNRRSNKYEEALERSIKTFVDALIAQWPAGSVYEPTGINVSTYISVTEAIETARTYFQSWYRNAMFKGYISRVQAVLDNLNVGDSNLIEYFFSQPPYEYSVKRGFVPVEDLMTRPAPCLSPAPFEDFGAWSIQQQYEDHVDHKNLPRFLKELLSKSGIGFEQKYVKDLLTSFKSLQSIADVKLSESSKKLKPLLQFHLARCTKHVESVYHTIYACLRAESSVTHRLACNSKMWPRLSTISLLQQLAGDKVSCLRNDWRDALISYGLAISALQRAERLLICAWNDLELLTELKNSGHEGWDTSKYPDWVLFEIENNLLIRRAQAEIAQEMISPSSGTNSILQLNMGEGKSSVIVPIVAAVLADKKKLVRIVVLKPLSKQMFHLLLKKLGGMLNRRIFHMPFSRSIKLDLKKAENIQNLCKECMSTGGVLLIQPDHLLSMELVGPERLLAGDTELGKKLFNIQQWLEQNSRDILDESDEILSVRFELIYTMGTQRAIEFSPNRWAIVEHILELVRRFAQTVLQHFPHGFELQSVCSGSFPRLRILEPSAGKKLLELIAKEVCEAGLPGVPVWNLSEDVRNVLYRFLMDPSIVEADVESLQNVLSIDTMRRSLLLLKGLIAGGVLAFALQAKRWRVNYGLDLTRTMLAVPYRAKDVPAARAEFSHPDTTIVLTCLSYYQGGLSDEELCIAFEKLLLFDHAQEEYEQWVQDAHDLPPTFRRLTGINLSDPVQRSQIVFPALRLAKSAIDFYLSHVVFPKEMKEFPEKLSASGWDIARAKVHPITGFSGTNDSRYVLPLTISQCDLPSQYHTNAAVLGCLLRPENSFKHAVLEYGSESLDEESLLKMITEMKPPVRVIVDVGAQVLEWKNEEIARQWLLRVPETEAQAVVLFNDGNDLSVLSRDGKIESLMISPFAEQMDQCLVYLDEAHTRGTDLKLPSHYRAAVTLGPDLTKDRLVQACMRMRKLGKGQSVVFCGPLDVERKILDCCGKTEGDTIEVADVLRWSISETCISTKKCIPLWGTQGIRHLRQQVARSGFANDKDDTRVALNVAKAMLEIEAQSLEDRYGLGARRHDEKVLLHNLKEESLSKCDAQLEAMRAKCREFGVSTFDTATLREEQERELSPENERERQIERPPSLTPHEHSIHRDLERFVHQGILDHNSDAFQPAFELFGHTTAVECLEKGTWSSNLVVTVDFARTVRTPENQFVDSFLRPVHWVASGRNYDSVDLVLLSPYEAHELLPSIRQMKAVILHVYSPRVSMSVATLEDLSFCAIPPVPKLWSRPSLIMQLNIFAGQLYLRNYEDYLSVCRFLGLCYRPPEGQNRVAYDGFIAPLNRSNFDAVMERECPFTISPVGFLRILMTLRRKGQGFERSHYGRILNAELLTDRDFFG